MSAPDSPTLRLLFWETTIRCNLRCAHCRRVETDADAGRDMTTREGMGLIAELAELGRSQAVMPVLVFSGGEPLCREDWQELIRCARREKIPCALASNGTMIDAGTAQRIAEAGVARAAISLDGATAEVHDRLRQIEGAFEKTLAGIGNLRAAGVPFQINTTLTKRNVHQLEEVHRLAKRLGAAAIHLFMLVPVGCGQILAETDMLSAEEYERTLIEICRLEGGGELPIKVTCGPHYERVIRQQGLHSRRKGHGGSGDGTPGRDGHAAPRGCLAGLGVLFVGHQGTVFPCGYLPIYCGNVRREKLITIWRENADLAKMRDSSKLEGKCGICEYRMVCGGCRGRAYGMTGNYMAEEPFCSYVPTGRADASGARTTGRGHD